MGVSNRRCAAEAACTSSAQQSLPHSATVTQILIVACSTQQCCLLSLLRPKALRCYYIDKRVYGKDLQQLLQNTKSRRSLKTIGARL